MKALSAFLLASLVPADAGDMLKRAASEMRCAPEELGDWLINKREAQRSLDMVASRHEPGPEACHERRPGSQGLRAIPRRTQRADPHRTAPSSGLGQSGTRPALLADWPGHPCPAKAAWLGCQSHRASCWRPAPGVPRHGRILAAKPQVHEGLCPGLA